MTYLKMGDQEGLAPEAQFLRQALDEDATPYEPQYVSFGQLDPSATPYQPQYVRVNSPVPAQGLEQLNPSATRYRPQVVQLGQLNPNATQWQPQVVQYERSAPAPRGRWEQGGQYLQFGQLVPGAVRARPQIVDLGDAGPMIPRRGIQAATTPTSRGGGTAAATAGGATATATADGAREAVRDLQVWINARAFGPGSGRSPITVDGIWGPQTEWAHALAMGTVGLPGGAGFWQRILAARMNYISRMGGGAAGSAVTPD
jgi:hypothetical protein